MTNVDRVKNIYEAFGRGDIAAILEQLDENVEWEPGVASTNVPWLQPRRGRAEVGQFFAALAGLEIHEFLPKVFLTGGDLVAVLLDFEATVKATGKRFRQNDEVHLWTFDARGRVRRFAHRIDTHQQWEACQP